MADSPPETCPLPLYDSRPSATDDLINRQLKIANFPIGQRPIRQQKTVLSSYSTVGDRQPTMGK
jgi:hypothetical protein